MIEMPTRFPATAQDMLNYAGRQMADQQIRFVATFDRRLDSERLARAVRLTVDAEPALGSRFVDHLDQPYWERRDDLDYVSLCQVVESDDAGGEFREFTQLPMDPCVGPQVQVRVFRYPGSQGDTLCIKIDHVVADWEAAKEYVYLLASTYRKLAADPQYRLLPNLGGSRGQDQVFRHFEPWVLDNLLRRMTAIRPAWSLPPPAQDVSGCAFAVRRIDRERVDALKAYARVWQSSVSDAILAAFYRALFEVFDPAPGEAIPVQTQIDLRRYLPSRRAEALCNLSGAIYPAIAHKTGASFTDTLAQVQTAIERLEVDNPGIGEALYLEMAFKQGFAEVLQTLRLMMRQAATEGKFHPCLTNFGTIDRRQLSFGNTRVLDAYMVGPITYPPGFMLGVSAFSGTLTLTAGYVPETSHATIVTGVLDAFTNELPL
ncbi:MAG: hypothetical protein HYY30_14690 [Chloroflexi bacterium]|nr:hypothetical protein [Chloroflexota bacterium]